MLVYSIIFNVIQGYLHISHASFSPRIFRTGGFFKTLGNVDQAYSEPCHEALLSHIQAYSEPSATLVYTES